MSALVDLGACFSKVPITFRAWNQIFKSNPQRKLKKAGPSEQISPVCFVTDKQNKTIEISIELSWMKQQLSGLLRLSRNVWISNYWDLLEETTESETAVLNVNEPRYTHFKNTKPWWNANGIPLTRIPKLTLLIHNTKGSMIWVAYSLEEVVLASLIKATVVLHFRLTCSWCLYASKKTLSMTCYTMPLGLTRDGSGCGIWNSRKNPFSKVHKPPVYR